MFTGLSGGYPGPGLAGLAGRCRVRAPREAKPLNSGCIPDAKNAK